MGKILQILIIKNRDLAHAQTFCTRVAGNREEKSLRHVVMVAKFLDNNKPKTD